MTYRHNNGGNVSFADGHCKWLERGVLYRADGSAGWNNSP